MEIENNKRFYVVEFLEPPYRGFDQYVCIPESWVQMHDESKKKVLTKYPVEKSSETEQRIKQGDISPTVWPFNYMANIIHYASSYEEAKQHIKTLENRVVLEGNYPELTKEDDDGNVSSGTRMAESQITSFNDNVEPASEQTPLTNSEIETHKKQAYVVKSVNSTNELTYQTPTSSKSLNDKQLPSTSKKSTRKIYDKESNNADRSEINDKPGDVTGNESFVTDNTPNLTNESMGSSNLMKEINPAMLSAQSTPINNHLADRYHDSTATISKDTVATEVEEEEEREKEKQVAKKTQVETGVFKRKEATSEERGDDDGSKKKKVEPRVFSLPDEYDENDPKWNLRYRQPSEGLVELKKGSGIYVNAVTIFKCERDAGKDWITLARILLSEIFTEKALETCVLDCPFKSNALCKDSKDTLRPLFYEPAKTVFYDYVENYARAKQCETGSKDDIINYTRKRIQHIRENIEKKQK